MDTCTRVWESQVLLNCAVAFSPKNDVIAWLGHDYLDLLDPASGEKIIEIHLDAMSARAYIAWASDATRLLMAGRFGGGCEVRLWDMESARSTKQIHLLSQWNVSFHASFCAFFDGHRYALTDHGLFPILPEHRPPYAAGDLVHTSSETLLRLRDDGWI